MSEAKGSWGPLIGKAIVSGWTYAAGVVIAGMVTGAFHLVQPVFPGEAVTPMHQLARFVGVSGLLGLFLAPLVRGFLGGFWACWTATASLMFICLGVNNVIEILIYTTVLAKGGAPSLLVGELLGSVACGAVATGLLRTADADMSRGPCGELFFQSREAGSWTVRIIAAVIAFPLIYFIFGMMVAPFVLETYRHGNLGLVLPSFAVIVKTQLVRSALFLAASLPFIACWRKSRAQLIVALGLAHWMLVGLFGLLQTTWFPMTLRVAHSLEIGADSFAYAAALVFLLRPRE
ncbi:MAG TPA: hypothetical protein VLX32_02615 [Candidatus Acidoferrum sp.]|nr:hypothetical protein [Candidatus Acidoferrum sp.]